MLVRMKSCCHLPVLCLVSSCGSARNEEALEMNVILVLYMGFKFWSGLWGVKWRGAASELTASWLTCFQVSPELGRRGKDDD